MSEEDIKKNSNLLVIYFREQSNREKLIQNSMSKTKTFLIAIEKLNAEVQTINESLGNLDGELFKIKPSLNDLTNTENLLLSKIENRSNNLNKNMEKLTEIEFENYFKNNEVVLKKMKNIYGAKILEKVNKTQKFKFMENIIADHTFKKNKVNEFVKIIAKFEETQEFYYANISSLEVAFKKV